MRLAFSFLFIFIINEMQEDGRRYKIPSYRLLALDDEEIANFMIIKFACTFMITKL